MSPFIVVRTLAEAPSDRDLISEAKANIKHRLNRVERMMDDLYQSRKLTKLPFAVLSDIYGDEKSIKEFLYGEVKMETNDTYTKLINKIAGRMPDIKELFRLAADDVENAKLMMREIASSAVNKDFASILAIRPNERLATLLNEIEIRHP